MCLRNTVDQYGLISRWLHGIVMVLFSGMLTLGSLLTYLPKPTVHHFVVNIHKLSGIVTLGVGMMFLLWSLINKKPTYPPQMPLHERILATAVRFLLYLMMLLMPLSGWIMATAASKPPYIGNITFPCPFIGSDRLLAAIAHDFHTYFGWILFGLIVLHTIGALKHHFIDRNNLLTRMFKGQSSA